MIATTAANATAYSDTTLTEGTTYYYRLRGTDGAAYSAYSAEVNDTTLPGAPTALTATPSSPTQIDLAWTDNSSGETGYQVERKTGVTGNYAQVATLGVNAISYSDTALSEGTTYFYRIRAFNGTGNSAYSGEDSKTTPLIAPTGLSVTLVSSTQINLSWTDNSSAEAGYQIERKTGAAGSYAQIGTVTSPSYSDSTLAEGTTCYYRVRAYSGAANSAYSSEESGTTPLVAPTGLIATGVSNSQIDLTWADNSSAETGYKIERKTGSGGAFAEIATVGADTVSWSDTSLQDGTTCYYRVRAYSGVANSAYSSEESATTRIVLSGTILEGASPLSGVTLSGLPGSPQTDGSCGYSALLPYGWGGTITPQKTGYTFDPPSRSYFNSTGSRTSENYTAQAGDTSPPVITAGPSLLQKTDTTLVITWTTNEPANSVVEYGTTSPPALQGGSATSFTTHHQVELTGLLASTLYYLRVSSTDPSSNGPVQSAVLSVTTASAPDTAAPLILSGPLVVYRSDNWAIIQWRTDEICPTELQYGINPSLTTTLTKTNGDTHHQMVLTGLSTSTQYAFRAVARDLSNNGPTYSDTFTFTTSATGDINGPVLLSGPDVLYKTDTLAVIQWTTNEPSDSRVSYGPTASYGETLSDTALVQHHRMVLTGLSGSTTYHFQIASADIADIAGIAGNGPTTSSDLTFATNAAPDTTAPTITSGPQVISQTNTTLVIEWKTDEETTGVLLYGPTTGYGWECVSSRPGKVHQVVLTGLSAATLYHFRTQATDTSGQTATSADGTATTDSTPDTTPPVLSAGPTVISLSQTRVVLQWTLDEVGTGQVDYGATLSYGNFVATVEMALKHTLTLTNLTPGTMYHFRISSRDLFQNGPTASGDATFTTPTSSVIITNTALAQGTPGVSYLEQLGGTGGITPYTWTLRSGSLPPGLSLNMSDGKIDGTPTAGGDFTFVVLLEDSSNPKLSANRSYTISIVVPSSGSGGGGGCALDKTGEPSNPLGWMLPLALLLGMITVRRRKERKDGRKPIIAQ